MGGCVVSAFQDILLKEARGAKHFWNEFRSLLPPWCVFKKRQPHSPDITNKLLDIGYHHITNLVKKILEKYSIDSGLGILHVAHKTNSAPLAYDLVELFRSDIVDSEVLRFLRLKKKPIFELKEKDIARFISRINRRLQRRYFVKIYTKCCPYGYYMELQILKFIRAINHNEVFIPINLPTRHEGRCQVIEPLREY